MAEQAQNKLGELFVDIGSTGIGKLVKGLNSISASFLLGKKGAEEFLKPISNINKTALNTVIGYDKLNAVTGLPVSTLQQLDKWTKLNNVDFGQFMGQIQTLQQKIIQIQAGQGGNINGLALLGIDPRSLDFRNPLQALDVIRKKVQQLNDPATAAYALQMLGLSQDLLYIWQQGNRALDKRLLLNEQEMEQARVQKGLWNSLQVTWDTALQKILLKQTWLNDLLKNCTEWLNRVSVTAISLDKTEWFPDLIEALEWIWDILKKIVGALGKLHEAAGAFGRWFGDQMIDTSMLAMGSQLKGGPILRYKIIKEERERQDQYIKKLREQMPEKTKSKTGGTSISKGGYKIQPIVNPVNNDLSSFDLPPVPIMPASNHNNVNLNVTQNITTPDPYTAADKSIEYLKQQNINQILELQNIGGN